VYIGSIIHLVFHQRMLDTQPAATVGKMSGIRRQAQYPSLPAWPVITRWSISMSWLRAHNAHTAAVIDAQESKRNARLSDTVMAEHGLC